MRTLALLALILFTGCPSSSEPDPADPDLIPWCYLPICYNVAHDTAGAPLEACIDLGQYEVPYCTNVPHDRQGAPLQACIDEDPCSDEDE